MKICPACNESFGDEFSFCEIDGTRLKRQHGASAPAGAKKDWSLLGIALVLGAILITGASIIFTPKARVAPPPVPADSLSVATPQPATPTPADSAPAAGSADSASTEGADSLMAAESVLPTETRKREKPAKPEGEAAEAPDPKAAVAESDPSSKTAKEVLQPAPPPRTEPEVKEAQPEVRPRVVTPPPAEVKEAPKPAAKTSDKDADAKKKDDKKKKGGFFGVFKKIFGKDDKNK